MLLRIGLFLFTFPFSLVIAVLYPLFILAFRFVIYEILHNIHIMRRIYVLTQCMIM